MANQAQKTQPSAHTINSIPRRGLGPDHYFPGLPDGAGRCDLLRLVQDVGHEIGLTGGDIQHLQYLMGHTREIDWQPGAGPVVYKSVCKMARERGVTERQIHNRERKLQALGYLGYKDLENFRRTGYRGDDGRIVEAWGVSLAPLGLLYDHLVKLNNRRQADLEAFDANRRRLSGLRRRIKAKITAAEDRGIDVEDIVERFARLPRIQASTQASEMDAIISHAVLIDAGLEQRLESQNTPPEQGNDPCELPVETSGPPEQNFRQLQTTNNPLLSEIIHVTGRWIKTTAGKRR